MDEPSSSASQASRKADLAPLAHAWAAGEGAPDATAGGPGPTSDDRIARLRALRKGLDIRVAIMVGLIVLAAIVVLRTRHGVAYFFSSSTPTALGDVRQRWAKGDRELGGTHDTYVSIAGLVPTRVIAVAPDDATGRALPDDLSFVFYCPLFDVTVLSRQPVEIPTGGWSEFDPRLKELVFQGIIEPNESMVSWRGEGRLLRGGSAPSELQGLVGAYARRMGKTPDETWVLIEGQAPSSYAGSFILWIVALVPVLASVLFYIRARRAWERAVATGGSV